MLLLIKMEIMVAVVEELQTMELLEVVKADKDLVEAMVGIMVIMVLGAVAELVLREQMEQALLVVVEEMELP